jgi:hypothetical protein
MDVEQTTVVVELYFDELAEDASAEPIVRALLDRAVRRLHLLCATLLYWSNRVAEGASGETATGLIVGTPSSMAPEQALGRTREIGPLRAGQRIGDKASEGKAGRLLTLARQGR